MNAVRLEAADAARFPATAHARQQISRAFLDGIMGYALVGESGWAIVVGDFVELGGEPDSAVLSALIGGGGDLHAELHERHIPEPSAAWRVALQTAAGDPGLSVSVYQRRAFRPIPPTPDLPVPSAEGATPGVTVRPLDARLAAELAPKHWSADAVIHTMAPDATSRGFGFAAIADQRCVGVVGCYARYAQGIEVEIDTHRDYRGRGIATALAQAMLYECARRGLSCHWDAMNATSERLALRLGFQPTRRYDCVLVRHPG